MVVATAAAGIGGGPRTCSTPAPAPSTTSTGTQNQSSVRSTGFSGPRVDCQRDARRLTGMARTTVRACCNWKSVSGLVGS